MPLAIIAVNICVGFVRTYRGRERPLPEPFLARVPVTAADGGAAASLVAQGSTPSSFGMNADREMK